MTPSSTPTATSLLRRQPQAAGGLRLYSRRGSLMLSMLVVIIVTGLVTALLTLVMAGQRSVRFDTGYNRAIYAADIGLQRALEDARADLESLAADPVGSVRTGSGVVESGQGYEWTATKTEPSRWEIEAAGTGDDGVTRLLAATVAKDDIFNTGAFAAGPLTLAGGNTVSSYDSATGDYPTGSGAVGSNSQVSLQGGGSVDAVYLYAGASCSGVGCSSTTQVGYSEPKNLDTTFVEQDMAAACGATSGFPALDVAANATVTIPAGEQCYTSVHIRQKATVVVAGGGEAVLFVTDDVTIEHDVRLNCPATSCTSSGPNPSSPPEPLDLQIYSVGSSVTMGNHGEIAWLLYAPKATCSGANAQIAVYGAMICNAMTGLGGTTIYYDEQVRNSSRVRSTGFLVSNWREEYPDT